MCYIVAKKFGEPGCVAMKTTHGEQLVSLKNKLIDLVGIDNIQLITISRPMAYGEYEPYRFVKTPEEFESEVLKMHA